MRIAKWGNSLAIRLPVAVVEALALKPGDEIEIHVADGRELSIARKSGRDVLLNRLRAFRGRLPADFRFGREEANAREGQASLGERNALSPAERATFWRESVEGLPDTAPLSDEAISRESIYSARG